MQSVAKRQLTQRAGDGGDSPRFLGSFLALGLFRFRAECPSHPPHLTQTVETVEKVGKFNN